MFTPPSLKSPEEQARFKSFNADAAVVVAYGLILPKAILEAPRFGCFNIHASLLPRWRGAAPIQRAIMAGDAETGVAIMRIEEGLDTGAICLAERTPIWPDETAGELHDRLATLGADLMVKALGDLAKGSLACWPQHEAGVTYAAKIEPSETRIDWSRPAEEIQYQIQGLSPHPGAWFEIELTERTSGCGRSARPSPKARASPARYSTTSSPSLAAKALCASRRCSAPASARWTPKTSCVARNCEKARSSSDSLRTVIPAKAGIQ